MGVLLAGEELRTRLRGLTPCQCIALGDELMACLIKAAGLVGAAGAEDFLLSPRSSLFLHNFTFSLDF